MVTWFLIMQSGDLDFYIKIVGLFTSAVFILGSAGGIVYWFIKGRDASMLKDANAEIKDVAEARKMKIVELQAEISELKETNATLRRTNIKLKKANLRIQGIEDDGQDETKAEEIGIDL